MRLQPLLGYPSGMRWLAILLALAAACSRSSADPPPPPTPAAPPAAPAPPPPPPGFAEGPLPLCHGDGWCWVWPAPQGNRLTAAWVAPSGEAWVVGLHGVILHWRGGGWRGTQVGDVDLYAIWASGPTDLWIAGDRGTLLHGDGTRWTPAGLAGAAAIDLRALWGSGPADLWAAGSNQMLHWDGVQWSNAAVHPGWRPALWGSRRDDVWAAGDRVLHYDGHAWDQGQTSGRGTAVAGRAPDDVWIASGAVPGGDESAGYEDLVMHWDGKYLLARSRRWDGTGWDRRGDEPILGALAGDGRGTLWAAELVAEPGVTGGFSVRPLRWDGRDWAPDRSWEDQVDAEVWSQNTPSAVALGPDGPWLVGEHGRISHRVGGAWRHDGGNPSVVGPVAIWGSGPDDVWVGLDGLGHWDGRSWSGAVPAATYSMWGVAGGPLWAAGWRSSYSGFVARWDGAGWQEVVTARAPIFAVGGCAADDVWAVGRDGGAHHWNGTAWSTVATGSRADLFTVLCLSAGEVWVAGRTGTLLRWDGTRFAAVPSGTRGDITGLSSDGAGGIWSAVDQPDGILRRDHGRWTVLATPVRSHSVRSVHALAPDQVWAVGEGAWRWDGTRWNSSGAPGELVTVWASRPDDVWAAGRDGVLRRRR